MKRLRNRNSPRRKSNKSLLLKCLLIVAILDLLAFHTCNLQGVETQRTTSTSWRLNKVVSPESALSSGSFDIDKMELSEVIQMYSRSSYQHPLFGPLLDKNAQSEDLNTSPHSSNAETTLEILQDLGINQSCIESEGFSEKLPSWSQITDNYGDRPVVLGLERCKAYRETVPIAKRIVGLTGLFSSGTNVMHHLLLNNCKPPEGGQKRQRSFQWQVPWGKHHPANTRMQYAARDREFINQTAVLPVVTVRHPITWLDALCRHGYSLHWDHNPDMCDTSLRLNQTVHAKFGYTNQSIVYDSLVTAWRDWNLAYFSERKYPLLMTRLEDIVYKPKQVVEEICHCIGGQLYPEKTFSVFASSMNDGKGHGEHRSSGLLSAFVKFAKPIKEWRNNFSEDDWNIVEKVLQDDNDLLASLNYRIPKP